MAIYQGTALVSRIIGKLGTNDFMRWKNKNVVRTSPPVVTDPNSTRQAIMRAAMATSAALWRDSLTDAQRSAWDTYAKTAKYLQAVPSGVRRLPQGNGGKYSGIDALNMTNLFLGSVALDPVTDAPIGDAQPSMIEDFTASWNEGLAQLELSWTTPPDSTVADRLRVWISHSNNAFHKQIIQYGDPGAGAANIDSVNGALGADTPLVDFAGATVFVQLDWITTKGRKSPPTKCIEVLITAGAPI